MSSFQGLQHLFLVITLLVVSVISNAIAEDTVRYDDFRLLRVYPVTEEHITGLYNLKIHKDVDFWIEPKAPERPVDILVSPRRLSFVSNLLKTLNIRADTLMENVQSFIGDTEQFNRLAHDNSPFDWTNYHSIDSINEWLKEQAKYYNDIATLIFAGNTTEGRVIQGLRISFKPNQPIIFLEAGIHAREWIGPAAATWFIQQILNTTSDLIKSYEWHVFPSVNPDGYAYTQKDRLWRKTRSKSGFFCYGVDANRNWPFKWQGAMNSCSETYPGGKPASEPETRGLKSYLDSVAKRTKIYISLHSYSQLLMYPWAYTEEKPSNAQRFDDIAAKAVASLKAKYGTTYQYGPVATTIYQAYGSTLDYAYSVNITYPFVFELRDAGKYGFLLPKEQIIPTATETFDAIQVILEEAKK